MVKRTLGGKGAVVSSSAYLFLHYALLVAYTARAGGLLADVAHQPFWLCAALVAGGTGGMCYACSPKSLDTINTGLLGLVIVSFIGLLGIAAPGIDAENLAYTSWPSIIGTLPVVALAFVYHNIVPTVVSSLEGDIPKTRTAVLLGLAVPLFMFIGWEAAILGSVPPGAHANMIW